MRRTIALTGLAALSAAAIVLAVQTGSSSARIDTARAGASIRWPSGDGQRLSIVGKSFDPAITIDASRATFSGIVIRNSRGVHIKGGTVIGPGGRSYGIHIDRSRDVAIEGMTITGAHRGIVIGLSEDIVVRSNKLTGLISDGIDIALSRKIAIERNECASFSPTKTVFDSAGKRISEGDHPDCIQAWSRPKAPPTADIRVVGNKANGRMQGIFFGNHVRNGVDDGGFDRILIADNDLRVATTHGISLYGARSSRITGNMVSTVPGSVSSRPPYKPMRATIRIVDGLDVTACGNIVESEPSSPVVMECRR